MAVENLEIRSNFCGFCFHQKQISAVSQCVFFPGFLFSPPFSNGCCVFIHPRSSKYAIFHKGPTHPWWESSKKSSFPPCQKSYHMTSILAGTPRKSDSLFCFAFFVGFFPVFETFAVSRFFSLFLGGGWRFFGSLHLGLILYDELICNSGG